MAMTTDEAVARVEAIVPMLTGDVGSALALVTVIRTAERTLKPELQGRTVEGARTFNLLNEALMLKLAMDAARIFDWSCGKALDDQHKASIPVLTGLLGLPDVAAVFVQRARGWTPGIEEDHQAAACRQALDRIIAAGEECADKGSNLGQALRRIRQYRTRRLAHMLFNKEPDELPTYTDVFALIEAAKPVVKDARFAINGTSTKPDWVLAEWRKDAETHYGMLSRGILVSLERDSDGGRTGAGSPDGT